MLEKVLNLEGVTVLDKKQQGSFSGGGRVCVREIGTWETAHGNYL